MIAERQETETPLSCPVLVTERLILRRPHRDDVAELAQLANNRRVADMLARMPFPYSEAHAEDFVRRTGEGQGCTYALTLSTTAAFIGCAGLDPTPKGLALGYWIGEPFWGKGYGTEAAHALVDLAFRNSEIDQLLVSCRVINEASRRVIHKCGFQYTGQGMMDSLAAGRVATEHYALSRSTWIALRSWPRA
jgi:RimJ/RimL family protein N-acetyltransferase